MEQNNVSFQNVKTGEPLSQKEIDEMFMRRCLQLAKNGRENAKPNPMVGAVIVSGDGRIIGEGYHAIYGDLHAERNAIKNLTVDAKGATIYVTLEPCCHYGKQPPCTEAILAAGITKVVIGSRDPNPLVSGKGADFLWSHGIKGVQMLREDGVTVVEDFMREECDELNPIFFHYITEKTPYVVMKYAMSMDGKIATRTGSSRYVTNEFSRNEVQKMRHKYRGIMAGIGTVLADDPMLNTRIEGLRSPVRIICDSELRIPLNSRICQTAGEYETIIACGNAPQNRISALEALGITVLQVPDETGKVNLTELMYVLHDMKIDSILLEGGGTLNESMLQADLVNEIKVFIAPKVIGGALAKSPVEGLGIDDIKDAVVFKLINVEKFDDDILLEYRR